MPIKRFPKTVLFLKFILLLIVVFGLSYCNSSTQVASSFGKRKYTKGHISHPVVNLKTEYASYDDNSNLVPIQPVGAEKANFTAPALIASNTSSKSFPSNQHKPAGIAVAKGSVGANNDNVSLKENVATQPDNIQAGARPQINTKANSFFMGWLICLGITILCVLIAYGGTAATGTTGFSAASGAAGCILGLVGTFAFIAAIVLFILWVVVLSKG